MRWSLWSLHTCAIEEGRDKPADHCAQNAVSELFREGQKTQIAFGHEHCQEPGQAVSAGSGLLTMHPC